MGASILGIISSVLLMIIGLWKYFGRKNAEQRKQAEQARKDMDNAKKNDSPSDFLDAFGRMR
jgi:ABC-type nickel/cobalt efflux system permease component RcnA